MKTSNTWDFKSIVGRVILGIVLASMICLMGVASAFADNDRGKGHGNKRGHYERRYDHDRNYRPYGHYGHYGYRGRDYDYRERAYYPPPPVFYAPPPPPGIRIFLPPPPFIR